MYAKLLIELISYLYIINLKAEIIGLVFTVPNSFNDLAKGAISRACEIVGLSNKLICFMGESNAAALAYCIRRELVHDETIMIFDFGGGVLNITLFRALKKGDNNIKYKVLFESGELCYGGDNIDDLLIKLCYSFVKKRTNLDIGDISAENQIELEIRAREAKERLSGVKSFRIPFTFCVPPFVEEITREQFHELIQPFINKTKKAVMKSLRTTLAYEVDRVILVGGSSQMRWVKDMLIEIFNDENKIYMSERPALDMSLGAAYYAAGEMGVFPKIEFEPIKNRTH